MAGDTTPLPAALGAGLTGLGTCEVGLNKELILLITADTVLMYNALASTSRAWLAYSQQYREAIQPPQCLRQQQNKEPVTADPYWTGVYGMTVHAAAPDFSCPAMPPLLLTLEQYLLGHVS